jgi:TM2 domain-containing membrane protein YozV
MFCPNCGKELTGTPEFCPHCGARLGQEVAGDVSPKSRLATTLLCILPAYFAGIAGIHRLYLGKIGTGVTMLVLSILGWATVWFLVGIAFFAAAGIWSLIDFIFAVSGNMKDKEGKLIKKW